MGLDLCEYPEAYVALALGICFEKGVAGEWIGE